MKNLHHAALRFASIGFCILSLSGCFSDRMGNDLYFWESMPDHYSNQLYPESYDSTLDDNHANRETRQVVVPQSYHLGLTNTPTTSKDEDRQWIDSQNPNAYTIQIAQDPKAAAIANRLQRTPKNERGAEIRLHSGSYLGVYGSYPSREEAEAKLNSLPQDLKNQAQVKNWQTIQSEAQN